MRFITSQFTFTFSTRNQIQDVINSQVEAKLKNAYSRQFYYLKYGTQNLSTLSATWNSTTTSTNTNTGYFTSGGPLVIGDFATSMYLSVPLHKPVLIHFVRSAHVLFINSLPPRNHDIESSHTEYLLSIYFFSSDGGYWRR